MVPGMEGMMVYIERQSDEVVSGPTHYIDVARSTDQSFRADQLPRSRVRRTPCFGWTPARLWAGVYYLLDEVTE